jgi:SAM-dependent methyltransferase
MPRNVADFDPTNRFTPRVADYVRFRPRYPAALLETLRSETGLTSAHVIADIGSGTGFSTEMFLANGNTVYGVEPNTAMRAAGEAYLEGRPRFTSIAGSAEATTLADASVDYIIAGQAFHWFDLARARAEFARILRTPGWLALFWNSHSKALSPFMAAYEALMLASSRDYTNVRHDRLTDADFGLLFAGGHHTYVTFPYSQSLDQEALLGRTFSSSYAPLPDEPRSVELRRALNDLFARFEQDGHVQYDYLTELYFGRIARSANTPA